MRRLVDSLTRRRWLVPVLLLVITVFPLVAVSPGGSVSRWPVLVLTAALVPCLFILGKNLSGGDPDAENRAMRVTGDPIGVALLSRWLRRSRHFRFVGGLVGTILGLGFADGSLTPVLVWMLAGITVGGALAEVHSLRRGPVGNRTAQISARRVADYTTRTDLLALVVTGAVALAALIATAVVDTPAGGAATAAILALITVGGVLAMQWLVVVRPRPALGPDLRESDDLMRRLAATQGFARPGIALAIALLIRALAGVGSGPQMTVLLVVLGLAALAWYVASWQSRSNLMAVRS